MEIEKYVASFVEGFKEANVNFVAGLPASKIFWVHKAIGEDPYFTYVQVTNEGQGVAICAGAWFGGKKPAILMENSGLYVSTYTLTRLCMAFGLPVMLIIALRGEVGDGNWWLVPWGSTTTGILDLFKIPYTIVEDPEKLKDAIMRTQITLDASKYPAAVVLSGELAR